MPSPDWLPTVVGKLVTFEYGESLPSHARIGSTFPVFGSGGEVGRHGEAMVDGPGIVIGRKGTVGSVHWSSDPFWPIDTVYYVRAGEDVDLRWFYWLSQRLGLDLLDSSTGVPGLNRNDAYRIEALLPPPSEQRLIAGILDTVDEAIRKTEQVIAKLKQMKRGLLHDLLTRGIDENGELRKPVRHPEQFKDSPLGRIPREWEVAPFRNRALPQRQHIKTGPFGSSLKQEHWTSEGTPVITIGALGEGEFLRSELLYVSRQTARGLQQYAVQPGDIVFSRVADVGRSAVVSEAERGWLMSSNLMWISLDPGEALPNYVQAALSALGTLRAQIRRGVNAGGREIANALVLGSLLLPWPSPIEQESICDLLQRFDLRVNEEKSCLAKLRLLKSGLMDDLLTGRVRVKVSPAAA